MKDYNPIELGIGLESVWENQSYKNSIGQKRTKEIDIRKQITVAERRQPLYELNSSRRHRAHPQLSNMTGVKTQDRRKPSPIWKPKPV